MPPSALRFGPFVLDLERLRLRGPAGEVELRPKSFEVLRHLAERPRRVVPKEALIGAVWPDVTVTDDSLTRCIGEVRRALADEGQEILKTVPRRGYMLDLPAAEEGGPGDARGADASRPGDQPGHAGDDPAGPPFIAVLPFANLSGDPGDGPLCDGVTEDIITELSRFSELRVIARHSSFRYKGRPIDVREVGRELGARYVLEGGIRRGGDRVRVTAQLVEAGSGAQRWAERYDRGIEDVFALQDEVARAIASVLLAHVRRTEAERTLLKPPATWRAYDHFVRGLDLHLAYQSSQDVAALHASRRHLEQAVRLDPAYARPHSALAISHLSSWTNYGEGEFLRAPALERAMGSAREAVRLDPQSAHAQATFAWLLTPPPGGGRTAPAAARRADRADGRTRPGRPGGRRRPRRATPGHGIVDLTHTETDLRKFRPPGAARAGIFDALDRRRRHLGLHGPASLELKLTMPAGERSLAGAADGAARLACAPTRSEEAGHAGDGTA